MSLFIGFICWSAGFVYLLENQGDPSYFKSPSSQSLSYWNCVYFLMVTMSTVGYGDIVCVTAAGRGCV